LAALRALLALCFLLISSRERGKLQGMALSGTEDHPAEAAIAENTANLVRGLCIERHLSLFLFLACLAALAAALRLLCILLR
jgi:hypothetical protein